MSYRRQPTGDGCDTLYGPAYGQTFHSTFGALTEAEHVFLKGTAVESRLKQGWATRLLEVGFGTGLNFWLTASLALTTGAGLHYVALEKELLPRSILEPLNHGERLEAAGKLRRAYLEWRDTLPRTLPHAHLHWAFAKTIHLELVVGDATEVKIPEPPYHAIYHDAFSPDANPELWTQPFLACLFAVLSPGGKLATYSVKGTIRRNLAAVGFEIEKQPGPPGKREMLVATRCASS